MHAFKGATVREKTRLRVEPMVDYGFFGPDSVTWKVWPPSDEGLIESQMYLGELDLVKVQRRATTNARKETARAMSGTPELPA
jgi:hypothetical protein